MWLLLILLICKSNALIFSYESNFGTDSALKIHNPSVHQTYLTSIYNEARYFTFEISTEKKLEISLFTTSSSEDNNLNMELALLCSEPNFDPSTLSIQSQTPYYYNATNDLNELIFQVNSPTDQPVRYYGEFYPASKKLLADFVIADPPAGTYFLVLIPQNDNQKSRVGFKIGSGMFDELSSFLLTPINIISFFRWQHKSIISITVPIAAPILIGLIIYILLAILKKKITTIHEWIMALASLAFLSTLFLWLTQLIYSVIQSSQNTPESGYSSIIVILSFFYFLISCIEALRKKEDYPDLYWNRANKYLARFLLRRAAMLVWSGLALFTWSGYIVGPGLIVIAALLPPRIAYYPQSKMLSKDTELAEMDVQRKRYSL